MNTSPGSGFRTFRGYQLKNQQEGGLTPALEDYLEMVYRVCLEDKYVRVGKLSGLLQVKPSSASKMIQKLVDLGYLAYDSYESILLTAKGKQTGAYLLDRHDTVEHFLTMMGNTNPLEEAELIEHSLSASTVSEIKILTAFITENPVIQEKYEAFKQRASESKQNSNP